MQLQAIDLVYRWPLNTHSSYGAVSTQSNEPIYKRNVVWLWIAKRKATWNEPLNSAPNINWVIYEAIFGAPPPWQVRWGLKNAGLCFVLHRAALWSIMCFMLRCSALHYLVFCVALCCILCCVLSSLALRYVLFLLCCVAMRRVVFCVAFFCIALFRVVCYRQRRHCSRITPGNMGVPIGPILRYVPFQSISHLYHKLALCNFAQTTILRKTILCQAEPIWSILHFAWFQSIFQIYICI